VITIFDVKMVLQYSGKGVRWLRLRTQQLT
jgi:hypothetical protein